MKPQSSKPASGKGSARPAPVSGDVVQHDSAVEEVGASSVETDPLAGIPEMLKEGATPDPEFLPVNGKGPKFGVLVLVKSPVGDEIKAKRAHEGWWLTEGESRLMWIPEFWREIPAE